MVTWRESAVDERAAHRLLTEYFTSRAETFPGGGYVTVFPSPADFEPPRGEFVVLVDDDGTDVGCGGIRRSPSGAAGLVRYEVKHLWLEPQARGRGLGRAILSELERRARDLGAEELVLDTNASLAAAGGLYRSSGYVDIPPYNDNPNATNWYLKTL
ncbi:GNAT family N-acetyltransferase [Lacisediminihabitans changchengi]|uniref:GNAT family N-acetyltransferase n=1 Tax=Lacisediminihabitans changchengi TaxID=2787634 RepID=A0A934SL70_9MICO|nr:GNAT family N-acetyltransferase [Lacisediminihabitans changchengi]MBK4347593.1 GNAT family N-acetyltransferase [Lacisediminihabitans changchengi]